MRIIPYIRSVLAVLALLFSISIFAASAPAAGIDAAEAFFDNPGLAEGSGTPLTLESSGFSFSRAFADLDTSTLSVGPHTVYVRFRDSSGDWSEPVGHTVHVPEGAATGGANRIAAAEAFWDDPDTPEGAGTLLLVDSTDFSMTKAAASLDTGGLAPGIHTIYIRFLDDAGDWSEPFVHPVYIPEGAATGGVNRIAAAEYFVDVDPGEGTGTAFAPPQGQLFDSSVENILEQVDITGLNPGLHTLYIRFQDTAGFWSAPLAQLLPVPYNGDSQGSSNLITSAAFRLDAASWQSLPAEDAAFDEPEESVNSTVAVTPTYHRVQTRFQDSRGYWSDEEPLPAHLASDSDFDGLADAWELAQFGHLNYSGLDDPDNDGKNNFQELFEDTAPGAFEGGDLHSIAGTVTGPEGGVSNAAICVSGKGMTDCQTRTEADGSYIFDAGSPLPAGEYNVWPEATADSGDFLFTPNTQRVTFAQAEVRADFTAAPVEAILPPVAGHLLGDPQRNGIATPAVGFGVNTVNGNFYFARTLVTLPGKELPFVFSISYNSLDDGKDGFGRTREHPLGLGWTHSLNISLQQDGNLAELIWGDGRRDVFVNSGSWAAASPGNFAVLGAVSGQDYTWEVTTKDQLRYRFDAAGRLYAIVSRSEHSITATYDAEGRLAGITDTAGRAVSFTYSGDKLTQVDLPLSRTLAFAYSGDFLRTVTDMRDNLRHMIYQNNRLRRLCAVNASLNNQCDNAVELQLSFDDQARVTVQETGHTLSADNGKYNFTWTADQLNYQDPTGKGARFERDAADRITAVTPINVSGAKTRNIAYAADSGPTSVLPVSDEDGENHATQLVFDSRANLETVLPSLGNGASYTYNTANDLTEGQLADGALLNITRTSSGAPNTVALSGGGLDAALNIDLTYKSGAAAGLLASWKNTATGDRIVVDTYSNDGQPLSITRYPDSSTPLSTTFSYDAAGRRTSATDHRGLLTCYFYDAQDNLTHVIQGVTPDCPTAPDTIAASENVRHTASAYDADNRLIEQIQGAGGPDERILRYEYNETSNVLYRIIDHNSSREQVFSYTGDRELYKQTFSATGREDRFYKLGGGRIQISSANANSSQGTAAAFTRQVFDGNGQLSQLSSCTSMDQPDEPSSDCSGTTLRQRIFRDALGRPTQVILNLSDTETRTTNYSYSDDGRTVTVQHVGLTGDAHEVYVYNALGRVISVTHSFGAGGSSAATAEYDASGRVSRIIDPQGLETAFTYDGLGRKTARTDLRGTVTWTYDDINGTVTRTEPDSSIVVMHYTLLGELSQVVTGDGSTFTYQYDSRGRLIAESWVGSGGSGSRQFSYNVFGELTRIDGPFNQQLDFTRDSAGRLSQKQLNGVTPFALPISYSYSYNAFDQIVDMNSPAGSFHFAYQQFTHALGSIVFPNNMTTFYERNSLGELIRMTTSNGSPVLDYQITLDGLGRRAAVQSEQPLAPVFGNTTVDLSMYTEGADSGLLELLNGSSVQYDNRGNISGLPAPYSGTFSYDALNRLTGNNGTLFRYDNRRNRIAAVRNGSEQRYVLDVGTGLPDLLAVTDDQNVVQQVFVHGPGGLLASIEPGKLRFVHQDFNQNVVALSDDQQEIKTAFAYTPYGLLTGTAGEDGATYPFRFAGGVGAMSDPEGTIYMRARQYHPGLRQFLTPDLIEGTLTRPQSLNRYGYVEGMALGGVDPSGLYATASGVLRRELRAQPIAKGVARRRSEDNTILQLIGSTINLFAGFIEKTRSIGNYSTLSEKTSSAVNSYGTYISPIEQGVKIIDDAQGKDIPGLVNDSILSNQYTGATSGVALAVGTITIIAEGEGESLKAIPDGLEFATDEKAGGAKFSTTFTRKNCEVYGDVSLIKFCLEQQREAQWPWWVW